MNKERDSLLLGISICSSMVRDTNSALLGVTGFNEVHIKHFYCMIPEPPLRGGIFSSTPAFEFCRAQTCPCHSPDNKLLNWPDQLTVLRLVAWDTKAKNKTDLMLCVTEVYWYRILFPLSQRIGTCEQSCQIIYSKIVKGEISHFQFRNCLSLSQWLNPRPNEVNPIFPGPR